MNEYKRLKKAMYRFLEANEEKLNIAILRDDDEELEKRKRRIHAINKCLVIMNEAK